MTTQCGERAMLFPGVAGRDAVGRFVAWTYISCDGTVEWWAYFDDFDDVYRWGDFTCVGTELWRLDAEYIGSAG